MDSESFVTELDFVCANGVTLTYEERASLQNSLAILKYEGKFKTVYLCGKIIGNHNDYYLAQGLGRDILRQRQTFYSTNGRKWGLLISPETFQVELTKYVSKQFSGDPAFEIEIKIPTYKEVEEVTVEMTEDTGGGEEGVGEEEEEGPISRTTEKKESETQEKNEDEEEEQEMPIMTEEERLAGVYQQIEHDASIAPRGAFMRTPTGEVLVNKFFRGLDEIQASRFDSYVHVRFPDRAISEKRRRHSEMEKALDFLDVIEEDIPRECWSIQVDDAQGIVIIRNLWWPGMVFYHRLNTTNFGYFYIGNGLKNNDLPFML